MVLKEAGADERTMWSEEQCHTQSKETKAGYGEG